jgi:lariat debranching enzyme
MYNKCNIAITKFGDEKTLLEFKPYFKQELQKDELGNPALEFLESKMQPSYWFSAHLHVKFAAIHQHSSGRNTQYKIDINLAFSHSISV